MTSANTAAAKPEISPRKTLLGHSEQPNAALARRGRALGIVEFSNLSDQWQRLTCERIHRQVHQIRSSNYK